jgi:ATP-dependent exoDNAse (exonuclease V) beta subunit
LIKQKSKEKKENIWVSCPLRVHWRCSKPMFSIINEIAYGGLMIYGKVSTSCVLPEPAWIHVCGQKSKGHWIEEEGEALDNLLKELVKIRKVNPKNIYLITPFRSVAEELKNKAKNYKLDEKKVGTVHASQGKEADIVILVLGGNPEKPRAKSWSAQKPNLLNVAISRARERLYVIGDRSKWKDLKYFCVMAENLKEASFDSHGINWDESKPVQDSTGVSKPDTISTQQPRMHPQPSRQPQDGIKLPTLPRDVLPFISATCERLFL